MPWINCNRGNPAPPVARMRITSHESNHLVILHRFKSNHISEGQYSDQIKKGPRIFPKTCQFQFSKRVEVEQGGLNNFHGWGDCINKKSRKWNIISPLSTCLRVYLFTFLLFHIFAEEVIQHAGEFHREDEFGGWACANGLECFKILQGHRLLVNRFGCVENGFQSDCKTFC